MTKPKTDTRDEISADALKALHQMLSRTKRPGCYLVVIDRSPGQFDVQVSGHDSSNIGSLLAADTLLRYAATNDGVPEDIRSRALAAIDAIGFPKPTEVEGDQ